MLHFPLLFFCKVVIIIYTHNTVKVLCCTKKNIKNNVKPQIAITTPDKLLTLFERAFFKFVVLFMSMEKT